MVKIMPIPSFVQKRIKYENRIEQVSGLPLRKVKTPQTMCHVVVTGMQDIKLLPDMPLLYYKALCRVECRRVVSHMGKH